MYQASLPFTQNKSTKTKTIPVGLKWWMIYLGLVLEKKNDKKNTGYSDVGDNVMLLTL